MTELLFAAPIICQIHYLFTGKAVSPILNSLNHQKEKGCARPRPGLGPGLCPDPQGVSGHSGFGPKGGSAVLLTGA